MEAFNVLFLPLEEIELHLLKGSFLGKREKFIYVPRIQGLTLPEKANEVILCLLDVAHFLCGKLRGFLTLLLKSSGGLLIESDLGVHHGHVYHRDISDQLRDFVEVADGFPSFVLGSIFLLLFEILQVLVKIQVPLVVPHKLLGHAEEKGGRKVAQLAILNNYVCYEEQVLLSR